MTNAPPARISTGVRERRTGAPASAEAPVRFTGAWRSTGVRTTPGTAPPARASAQAAEQVQATQAAGQAVDRGALDRLAATGLVTVGVRADVAVALVGTLDVALV